MGKANDRFVAAWVRVWIRLAGLVGLWWVLDTQEWIPGLVTVVVLVPALFAILVCGGPVAAYGSTCYTQVVERHGGALMVSLEYIKS